MAAIKQIVCVRTDLNMRKGKIAAQAAHASMAVFFDRGSVVGTDLVVPLTPEMRAWVEGAFTKIVLGVESEADLLRVHEEAKARDLPTSLITDRGHTEFHGVPTNTAVAVGPAGSDRIDAITGPDGLVKTRLI